MLLTLALLIIVINYAWLRVCTCRLRSSLYTQFSYIPLEKKKQTLLKSLKSFFLIFAD